MDPTIFTSLKMQLVYQNALSSCTITPILESATRKAIYTLSELIKYTTTDIFNRYNFLLVQYWSSLFQYRSIIITIKEIYDWLTLLRLLQRREMPSESVSRQLVLNLIQHSLLQDDGIPLLKNVKVFGKRSNIFKS